MRNTIIGIVIGVVVGVMIGATVVAPRLEEARSASATISGTGPVTGSAPETGTGSAPKPSNALETLALDPKRASPPKESLAKESQAKKRATLSAPTKYLRIISLYPAKTPILGELPKHLQTLLPAATGGRLGVTVYDPGILVETADTFNAVKSGTVDGVFAMPEQWDEDSPILQLFTAIPFGPPAQELLSWYYQDGKNGGRALFEAAMSKKGVHAILCGALPPEASGWYRAPVRSTEAFKGLNVRAFGLGGAVLAKLGANVQRLDAGHTLSQFEQGQLDGAEYSLPSIDLPIGFQKFARNYYFPGWHQPVTLFALAINKQSWSVLSGPEQMAIETVCGDNVRRSLTQADAQQFEALKTLSLDGVQVRRWPENILRDLQDAWKEVVRDQAQKDEDFASAWNALQNYRRDYAIWYEISRMP